MSKKKSGWVKYTAEELKSQYEKEFAAGKTRLTESEWVAVFMMNESERLNKAAPVDKQPVEKSAKVKKSGGRTVTVKTDQPSSRAKKKVNVTQDAQHTHDTQPAPAVGTVGGQPTPEFARKKMEEAAQVPLPPNPKNDSTILESGLTAKQELFCREYITDFNATRAAEAAGYSKKTARGTGSENLKKPDIQKFIHKLTVPRLAKLEVTADRIMQEYASMAFVNLGHFMARNEDGSLHTIDGMPSLDFDGVTDEMLAGLAGFETIILPAMGEDQPNPLKIKVKLADKKGALDVLAKRAGLLKEHVEVSGEVKVAGADDLRLLAQKMAFMLRKAASHDKKDG